MAPNADASQLPVAGPGNTISAPWLPEGLQAEADKRIQTVYETLSTLPSVASGSIVSVSPTSADVQAVFTQRDLLAKAKRKTSVAFAVDIGADGGVSSRRVGFPVEVSPQVAATAFGPGGTQLATRIVTEKEKKRRFVEIGNDSGCLERVEVTDVHGDFYTDEFFGGIACSASGRLLAYIAEEKIPAEGLHAFLYRQTWGERYSDKKGKPTLVVVDLDAKKATALSTLSLSPGQPVFIRGDSALLFHALEESSPKHGSVYCFNRPGGLYTCGLNGDGLAKISPDEGARCPRVTPDGSEIVYLSNPVTNATHNSCARLIKMKIDGSAPAILVDVVAKAADSTAFPGLYVDNLPVSCFAKGSSGIHVVCNSMWRSHRDILAVDVATGAVTKLTGDLDASFSVLDVTGGYILASRQTLTFPSKLVLGTLADEGGRPAAKWTPLASSPLPSPARTILSGITSKVVSVSEFVDFIVLRPADGVSGGLSGLGAKPPLVVNPHGGPNSAFATDFMLYPVGLAALGFVVVMVNFTGSVGYGQASVDALVGNVGTLDIEDTHACAQAALKSEGVDSEAVFVTGGSHGGYITGHLIAKYPKLFKAAVMRNPVLNMGHMVLTSDIPSWSYEESGMAYDYAKPSILDPDTYTKLFAMSPISGIDAVETPVLLMLGDIDKRVPPQDGLNYLHQLKARGRDAHCLWFPENGHPLDGMDAEIRGFEAMLTFFLANMPKAQAP
ncbi:Alpha/Beta hydrolase protein [Hyaloraphidium curvatum]|nr:Alpha/Beta hydrolase protein [Hyaloraphidium curvatum]